MDYKTCLTLIFLYHECRQTYPEVHGIDETATFVTLVPAGFWVRAVRAHALHKAIGQKALTALTSQLFDRVLQKKTPLMQTPENILSDSDKHRENHINWC